MLAVILREHRIGALAFCAEAKDAIRLDIRCCVLRPNEGICDDKCMALPQCRLDVREYLVRFCPFYQRTLRDGT